VGEATNGTQGPQPTAVPVPAPGRTREGPWAPLPERGAPGPGGPPPGPANHGARTPGKGSAPPASGSSFWFFATLAYFVFEYGRPQDRLPFLGALRPGLVLGGLLALSVLVSGKISYARSRQSTLLGLIVLYPVLFVPLAENNFYAYQVALGMVQLLPFYLAVLLHVDRVERLRTFVTVYLLLMIYICVSVIRFGAGEGMGSSFLTDANDYSLLLDMMLPFSFFLIFYERSRLKKLLCLAGCCLAVVALVISFSRGGFVGALVVGFLLWLNSPRKLLSLCLIAVLAAVLYFSAGQKYWEEMKTVTDTGEHTASERIETWKSGWNMFRAHPLGVGGGNFLVHFHTYQTPYFQRGMYGRAAHSVWVQTLTELGLPGFLLFLLILLRNVRDCLWIRSATRHKPGDAHRFCFTLSISFLVSMAGFLSAGTFLSVLYYPHFWYLTAMIVTTKNILLRLDPDLAA